MEEEEDEGEDGGDDDGGVDGGLSLFPLPPPLGEPSPLGGLVLSPCNLVVLSS